jgi:ABC-type uncharacterized transport system substrate-binding protein
MKLNKLRSLILLGTLTSPFSYAEKDKSIFILYEKGSRLQEITLDGIQSRLANTKAVNLSEESFLKNCDDGDATAVIAIGKPSLDKALETCKSTPVVFSLVSAPRFGDYRAHRNVTGVSFDLSFRLFLAEFQKIMKPGSRIGFIYSSPQNDFLTTEIDYVEGEFNFTGVRMKIENREQIGAKVKQLIEDEKVKAIWVLPDPLYNQAIFKKLADLCSEKGVLLVTNFEVLVTEAGAAIALAPSYFDTGVQTAEMAQKIISGTQPSDIAYQRPRQSGVYLNLKLFQELKIDLPDDLRFKEKVTTLLNEAQELQKDGNSGSALPKFREVLRYDKKNSTATYFVNSLEARSNLSAAYGRIQSGNRRSAIPLLISAGRFLPEARSRLHSLRAEMRGEVNGIFEQGVAQFKNKKYKECINTMNMVLMIDPGNREAEIYKEKSGKRAKAVSAIR